MDLRKPSLIAIKKELGPVVAAGLIVEELIRLQDFFVLTVKMNPAQIQETAEIILERFYFLRMDEIKLCFKNAKAGDYGELYNRLDGAVVMGWLNKYDDQRTAVVVKANKEMQVSNIYEIWEHPQLREAVHKVADHLRIKEVDKVVVAAAEPRPQNAASLFAQQVAEEFETLYRDNPNIGTPRMVFYKDAWRDQSDFYDLRFIEHDEEILKSQE